VSSFSKPTPAQARHPEAHEHSITSYRSLALPRDANAAIAFLVAAFGFAKAAVYRTEDGTIVEHAELRWPEGGGIMLGSVRPESGADTLPPGVGEIYVVTTDPDALYQRAKANGATITREMREEGYGSRGFTASDPEGVVWSFGTYAGADAPTG
jgi:uncharacterized glyoxalase superfamily protein PhnB